MGVFRKSFMALAVASLLVSGCKGTGKKDASTGDSAGESTEATSNNNAKNPDATTNNTSGSDNNSATSTSPETTPGPGVEIEDLVDAPRVARRGDLVAITYKATWGEGKVFREVTNELKPFWFPLKDGSDAALEGLRRGVPGMKTGHRRRITVPPELGFGDRQVGEVPAGSTLTFEAELVAAVRIGENTSVAEALLKAAAGGKEPGAGGAFAVKTFDDSAVKYVDLDEGTRGDLIEKNDTLWMLYRGWLAKDGAVFDSNTEGGKKPFRLELGAGSVIKGWDQGLRGMRLGGRRLLYIPSDLGYGKNGSGAKIPPDSDLIFEVVLLKVEPDTFP